MVEILKFSPRVPMFSQFKTMNVGRGYVINVGRGYVINYKGRHRAARAAKKGKMQNTHSN